MCCYGSDVDDVRRTSERDDHIVVIVVDAGRISTHCRRILGSLRQHHSLLEVVVVVVIVVVVR